MQYNPVLTFLQEADELLGHIEHSALSLETGEPAGEAIHELFRAFHTLKGSGAMCGLDAVAGLPKGADSVHTRIIVMELQLDGEPTVLGGVADSVHEVIDLDPGNIDPPPRIAMRWRTDFIQGMGKRGDDFIIILDVNAVFSSEELALVSDVAPQADEAAFAQ